MKNRELIQKAEKIKLSTGNMPGWIAEGVLRGELDIVKVMEYAGSLQFNSEIAINANRILMTGEPRRRLAHTYVIPEYFLLKNDLERALAAGRYPNLYRFTDLKIKGDKLIWPEMGYQMNVDEMNETMKCVARCETLDNSLIGDESMLLKSIYDFDLPKRFGYILLPGINFDTEARLVEAGISIAHHRRTVIVSWIMGSMLHSVCKSAIYGLKEAMDALAENISAATKSMGSMIEEIEKNPDGKILLRKLFQEAEESVHEKEDCQQEGQEGKEACHHRRDQNIL